MPKKVKNVARRPKGQGRGNSIFPKTSCPVCEKKSVPYFYAEVLSVGKNVVIDDLGKEGKVSIGSITLLHVAKCRHCDFVLFAQQATASSRFKTFVGVDMAKGNSSTGYFDSDG